MSSLAACSEGTAPVSIEDDGRFEVVSLGLGTEGDETAETCPTELNECRLQLIDDDLHCLCELDGIGVDAGGDPGTQPAWPDLPGWPDPDFSTRPVPPDGGGSPIRRIPTATSPATPRESSTRATTRPHLPVQAE